MRPMDAPRTGFPKSQRTSSPWTRRSNTCASCAGSAKKAKLRKSSPCWTSEGGRRRRPDNNGQINPTHFLLDHRRQIDEIFVAPEQSIPDDCGQPPHGLSQDGCVRFVPTQSCQAASPPTPGFACPGGFPRAARAPFRVAAPNVPRREKEESGMRTRQFGDRNIPRNPQSH